MPSPRLRRPSGIRLALLVSTAALLLSACDSDPDAGMDRDLGFEGPEATLLNGDDVAAATFTVVASGEDAHVDDIVLLLNDDDVTSDAAVTGTELNWAPGELPDGEHEVAVLRTFEVEEGEEPREPEMLHTWTFAVDATPPEIEITAPDGAVVAGEPVTVAGTTEPGAAVEVEGESTTADDDGAWEIELPSAPDGTLTIVAIDEAGNRSDDDLQIVTVASRVTAGEYRAAHLTGCAWGFPALRDPVLEMVESGQLNAVQLDLKDEDGIVNFDAQHDLAQTLRPEMTTGCTFNLEDAVTTLHDLGIPIIGRIVVYRDPVLVNWAWNNDLEEYATQTADGDRWPSYGAGMANPANADVNDYNIAIAEEAAKAGVDHILWDYIRRPEGPIENQRYPGLEGTIEEAIVDFVRQADERLAPYGVLHGASVFGIAATRPLEIAQDIPAMSEYLDYVAPMVYPDHWGPGEYGLSNPNQSPYEIVFESLKSFEEATEGTRARVIPWLGDFGSREMDAGQYIRRQIDATTDNDLREFILWNAGSRYTVSAIPTLD